MDKELMELITAAIEPLERFQFERKRIVATVLAECTDELLEDLFANSVLDGVIQGLKDKEIFRQAQASWMQRDLINRISQLGSQDNSSLAQSDMEGADTKIGDMKGQFQQALNCEQL